MGEQDALASTRFQKYSQELLAKIRAGVDIIDVISEHVVLRKSGSNYSGLCPFHSERTPSFSVSEVKQFYHCFGCKRSGDVFRFVQEVHGLTFPQAIEELAERARIPLPQSGAGPRSGDPEVEKRREAQRKKIATAWKLNRFAAAFYHQNLVKFPETKIFEPARGG